MQTLIRLVVLVCVSAFLSGCQTTTSRHQLPAVGSTHKDVFDLGNGQQIPLPEGGWTVAASVLRRSNAGSNMQATVLVDARDGVLVQAVKVTTMMDQLPASVGFNNGFVLFTGCNRTDVHFAKVVKNYASHDQECWIVNHSETTLANNAAAEMREAESYIRQQKISMPINVLYTFHHFANNKYQFIDVSYFFNPEIEGIAPPRDATWRTSDWHKDRVYMDSKKVEYVNKLTAWSEEWHQQVKKGFLGQLPIPTRRAEPAPVPSTREARLLELRSLRDKNLISVQEYDAKTKEILSGL